MPTKEDESIPAGWAIMKGKRPYFPKTFQKRDDADFALWELLDVYPPDSEWWQKLKVEWFPGEGDPVKFKPPYGYRYKKSRHGEYLVRYNYEQNVLVVLRRAQASYSHREIAELLNQAGFLTRKRKKFDKHYIKAIIEDQPNRKETVCRPSDSKSESS